MALTITRCPENQTGCVVKDNLPLIYYGCCNTSIGLATGPLDELVKHNFSTG